MASELKESEVKLIMAQKSSENGGLLVENGQEVDEDKIKIAICYKLFLKIYCGYAKYIKSQVLMHQLIKMKKEFITPSNLWRVFLAQT